MPRLLVSDLIDMMRTLPSGREIILTKTKEELVRLYSQKKEDTKDLPPYTLEAEQEFDQLPITEQHPKYYCGVPQGNPLSPLMSSVILLDFLYTMPQIKVVQYADDGILYSDTTTDLLQVLKESIPEGTGIKLKESKCQDIKQKGHIYLDIR